MYYKRVCLTKHTLSFKTITYSQRFPPTNGKGSEASIKKYIKEIKTDILFLLPCSHEQEEIIFLVRFNNSIKNGAVGRIVKKKSISANNREYHNLVIEPFQTYIGTRDVSKQKNLFTISKRILEYKNPVVYM